MRAAIVLLWVKLAVGALATILLVAVPGLRDQALDPAGAIPVGFVVGVIALAVVVGVLGDPDVLASAAPLLVSFTSDVVITALWVAIVVLLFLPASRWWLSERTAQRQRDRRLPRGPAERW